MNQNFAIGMFIDSILKTLQLMKIVTNARKTTTTTKQTSNVTLSPMSSCSQSSFRPMTVKKDDRANNGILTSH